MAARKTAKKKTVPKKKKKAVKKKAVRKTAKKAVKKTKKKAAPRRKPPQPAPGGAVPAGGNPAGLRIRMYRVGFGDFFLMTVPTDNGPRHILIDCGVHAKDTHSIKAAVEHMAQETGKKLALIIVTHRHADHVTGFAKCKELFGEFEVERVWLSWYENPKDGKAMALQANIAAAATQIHQSLSARSDPQSEPYRNMVANITDALSAAGGSQNPEAMAVLKGFPGNPIRYYKAGDAPDLPDDLVAAGFAAQILGPPSDASLLSKTDKAAQEYLAGFSLTATDGGAIFPKGFSVKPERYKSPVFEILPREEIEARIAAAQPDQLAVGASIANNQINNQSLVTLFTFNGKTLLFAGDAQWGNWANFMFGGVDSATLKAESKAILGNLDFYKVGHHGSTNATPKDALAAMKDGCVAMCSTAIDAYPGVPRDPLIAGINSKTRNQLARSDQVAAGDQEIDPRAGKALAKIFDAVTIENAAGKCGYIDYVI
ncbi:MAG: MBL fold metallo-hydrolase [Rhizomicrobium sp.]